MKWRKTRMESCVNWRISHTFDYEFVQCTLTDRQLEQFYWWPEWEMSTSHRIMRSQCRASEHVSYAFGRCNWWAVFRYVNSSCLCLCCLHRICSIYQFPKLDCDYRRSLDCILHLRLRSTHSTAAPYFHSAFFTVCWCTRELD